MTGLKLCSATKTTRHLENVVTGVDRRNSEHYLPLQLRGELEAHLAKTSMAAPIITLDDVPQQQAWLQNCFGLCNLLIRDNIIGAKRSPSIYFCFLNSDEIDNALCLRLRSGPYVICISSFMITRITLFSQHLMSTAPVGRLFCIDEKLIRFDEQSYQSFERLPNGFPKVAFSPDIINAILPIYSLAVGAVLLHELGHIMNGHVDGMADVINKATNQTSQQISLARQTLEVDADAYAAFRLFAFLETRPQAIKEMFPYAADLERRVHLAALVLTISHFFDNLIECVEIGWRDKHVFHHPMKHRIRGLSGTLAQVLAEKCKVDWYHAHDTVGGILAHCVAGSAFVYGTRATPEDLAADFEKETHDFVNFTNDFISKWAEIRPVLEPFRIGVGKLAPVQEAVPLEELVLKFGKPRDADCE